MNEDHDDPTSAGTGVLAGFTIVLTSDRRSEEFAASFTRRGAIVLRAPTLRIVPTEDDAVLAAATRRIIDNPPDDLIVTTAIGFRGWIEAADAHGHAEPLIRTLTGTRILARGPKGRGAIRATGLSETWSAATETTLEVVEHLLAEGVQGRRIAVQQHGLPDDDLLDRLRDAGAELETFQVYRWGPSPDPTAVQRAIDAVCADTVDAVTFTSAPGCQALLDAAQATGQQPDLLHALRHNTIAAAVGPVTAAPLLDVGVSPLVPDRHRLGALVRSVTDHLTQHHTTRIETTAGTLEMRGHTALLSGSPLKLTPSPFAILRQLTARPGEVIDRATLLAALPGDGDMHALDVAVARLRAGMGEPNLIQTIIKRGYRLDVTASPRSPRPGT